MAIMSILGLYNYDNSILDGIITPDGVEKDTLISSILLECAELEVIYPQPDTLRTAIELWSKTMQYKWAKLARTLTLEYNPIENYDRIEESSDNIENGVSAFNSDAYQNASRSYGLRRSRIHGNIGVTTSQQMLMSERDVADFNIYDVIVDDFKKRFCLLIY